MRPGQPDCDLYSREEATARLTVRCGLRWWLKPYLYTLLFFAWLHNTAPDAEKLQRVISKGIWLKIGVKT